MPTHFISVLLERRRCARRFQCHKCNNRNAILNGRLYKMLISILYVGVSQKLTLMKCKEFRQSTAVSVVPTVENRNTHGAFPDTWYSRQSRGQSILADIMTMLKSFIATRLEMASWSFSKASFFCCVFLGLNVTAAGG